MSTFRTLALSAIAFAGVAILTVTAQTGGGGAAGSGGSSGTGARPAGATKTGPASGTASGTGTGSVDRGGGQTGFKGVDGAGAIRDGTARAYTGRVARVDVEKRTIDLKGVLPDRSDKADKGGDVRGFRIAKDTPVTLDGAAATLGRLKVDMYVQVITPLPRPERTSADDRGEAPAARSVEAFTRDPGPGGTGGARAAGGTGVTGGTGGPARKDKDR